MTTTAPANATHAAALAVVAAELDTARRWNRDAMTITDPTALAVLAVADMQAAVLAAMNATDATARQYPGSAYQCAVDALLATLGTVYAPHVAARIYESALESGESVSYAAAVVLGRLAAEGAERAAESAALWTAVDTSTDDDAPGWLDLVDAAL